MFQSYLLVKRRIFLHSYVIIKKNLSKEVLFVKSVKALV
jgi:hypothetical protein